MGDDEKKQDKKKIKKPVGQVVQIGKEWWVAEFPNPDCGPYHTRKEAEECRRGLQRFYKHNVDLLDPVELVEPTEPTEPE